MARFDWSEEKVRRLYHLRVSEGASANEIARLFGGTRAACEMFCSNHFITPVGAAAPLSAVLEIFRRGQGKGGTARMTNAEETQLRMLWAEPGATLRSVGLALLWRRELLIKRALSLRLGPVGDPLPDTPAARAALDVCHPRETRKLDTICRLHETSAAEVLAMVKRIAPKHDAIMKYDQTRRAEASGPPIPDGAIHARRLEVLRDRALRLVGGGVRCPHSLARELDPLGEHRLSPAQAATLAGLGNAGGAHA
ncbi:hypothetical protein OA2633_00125 [Oceanicaulis sp. HTCC2633]|uniref:hypothetical protein n=1 Tax=Oceanicaulis sp. HTCC2633 TaxID=314254 RepID=UPI0000669A69|nr:hypothetical protein [Oceanicaulis sp. HTCC2633]EAP89152.1 hypothetical protein OA2633_00125 [Oceanicaulis sp. HTCC2633]